MRSARCVVVALATIAVVAACAAAKPESRVELAPPRASREATMPTNDATSGRDARADVLDVGDGADVLDAGDGADVLDAGDDSDAPPADPSGAQSHEFQKPLPQKLLSPKSIARRFANLPPTACRAEASRRKLGVWRDRRPTPGVATAFRVKGPFRGVVFRTAGKRSRFGVFDCRLGLVFDELAALLAEHGVTEVHIGTIHRPGSTLGPRAKSQHHHGLAADVVGFKLKDGRLLLVERDFRGAIGEPPCGPRSRVAPFSEDAVVLRNLVCAMHRRGLFHHILTPSYDRAHHDHVHLDIKRNALHAVIR